MRKVEFKKWIPSEYTYSIAPFGGESESLIDGTGCYSKEFSQRGELLSWSVENDHPVALVEMPDKTVRVVAIFTMRFID